ncbi:MAG: acylphosphatase [Bacteroidia bacterium]
MKKQIQIKITGNVQGVFFRNYALEKAVKSGIKGFVKNMPDGEVYIEAYGDDDVLSLFIDWCYTGSPKAQVENVEVKEMNEISNFSRFEIR